MKITTLIAAAALATASTAATAQNVTTTDGDVVMIEKNQAGTGLLAGLGGAGGIAAVAGISILVIGLAVITDDPNGGT